ncbi:MAG: mannose-1-phosphate guanylyltransferase [Planctomycetota bacterium]
MSETNIFAVVLAGGRGKRFWPAGRHSRPKQLLAITTERTMLEETLSRCSGLAPPAQILIVTNSAQAEAVRKLCPDMGEGQVLVEPAMRNTAAAIGLAALHVRRADPDGIMVILAADHAIEPRERFLATFRAAARRAGEADTILVIGIPPTGPATGYGYIEAAEATTEIDGYTVHRVSRFKEKPDAATAHALLEQSSTFWNSGTFVGRAATLVAAFEEHLPDHARILGEIDACLAKGDPPPAELYEAFENVPFDVGIVEKAQNVEVIPADFEWDDVGSWLALGRIHRADQEGNVVRGKHAGIDTHNCIVVGDADHLVTTVGLEDMIVIHTPDATLICPRDRAEDVRRLVDRLGELGLDDYL